MLISMWFFHRDAICPDGISESVVKHHRDSCPNNEKWFDVPVRMTVGMLHFKLVTVTIGMSWQFMG